MEHLYGQYSITPSSVCIHAFHSFEKQKNKLFPDKIYPLMLVTEMQMQTTYLTLDLKFLYR
jgi:hypothetical protein